MFVIYVQHFGVCYFFMFQIFLVLINCNKPGLINESSNEISNKINVAI